VIVATVATAATVETVIATVRRWTLTAMTVTVAKMELMVMSANVCHSELFDQMVYVFANNSTALDSPQPAHDDLDVAE
jgi:hypothetical protein